MKTLLLACFFGSMTLVHADDFGTRSKTVTTALEEKLGKKAADITAADLASIEKLELPHIHLEAFLENDFAGLINLKELEFASLFHRIGKKTDKMPPPFVAKVFAKLTKLEKLTITEEQLGSQLPDDVFEGLVALKVLDLTDTRLVRFPSSVHKLPKLESVIFRGVGMSPEDFAKVKEALGKKLKAD